MSPGNSTTATLAACVGIALNNAATGQPVAVQSGGTINIGATATVGAPYFLSANSGNICPAGDLANPNYTTYLGIAITANNIQLAIQATGIQHA